MSDLISRQAAIDTLATGEELLRRVLDDMDVVGNEREKYEWGLGLIESYIADMKELPSAQPERKRGKWLWLDGVRCSNCNHKLQTTGLPSYCPNCGADMRGENDEADRR